MTRRYRLLIALTWSFAAVALAQPPDTPPAGGTRGAQDPAAAGRGGRAGGRRGGFPQLTRQLAPQDVLARGKALYETNCASCHAADMRGTPEGTRLLRSQTALNDQHGELIAKAIAEHKSKLNIVDADNTAIAEYIHSVLATTGGQGSPPGRNPAGIQLNVLVGDAKAGAAYFDTACASCHSVSGDLQGIGAKIPDPRALQNAWVGGRGAAGGFGGGGGGRGGGGAAGEPATVTMADGTKIEGKLVRKDDFIVILTMPDGSRKSIARDNGIPKVDVKDPNEAHKKMVLVIDDPENKHMHDITAYLSTLK